MQLFSTLPERLEDAARIIFAYCMAALIFTLEILLFPAPFDLMGKIPFAMTAIFLLAVYNPTLISPIFLVAAGILIDVLTGMPLGLSAMVFLLLFLLTTFQSSFLLAQSFILIWLIYGVIHASMMGFHWLVFSLINMQPLATDDVILQFVIGFFSFPIIFWICTPLRRITHGVR